MKNQILALSFALFGFAFTPSAQAETTHCTAITTLPYTITTQGVYCLTGNLGTSMTSGNAITISTDNVVLDLNGFKIGGLGAGTGTLAIGIYAMQHQNISIKNGTVRGFLYGICIEDLPPYTSQGHVIEDIRADQNTYMGMLITGNGDMIRNNLIITTGGSTTLGANANANGIYVLGSGAQVLNNTVTGVSAQASGNTTGVYLDSASNSVVADNRIGNLTSPNGSSYGVFLNSGSDLIVSDNRLTGMQYGIYFANATGKFFSNVAQGVSTPYTGGIAAGITNY